MHLIEFEILRADMMYQRNTITERARGSTQYPKFPAQPVFQCPRPVRLAWSNPSLELSPSKRPSISPLVTPNKQDSDTITARPTAIRAENFPSTVRERILGLLNFQDIQTLISVSFAFRASYMQYPARITEKVGRNSFQYDSNFGKYFPIDYPGCWLEENNKGSLPFPPWQRHLRHLHLLLGIEQDLFKISRWVHWGSCSTSQPHENMNKEINQEINSCPLRKGSNYQCGRTYCVLIDFAQRGLYGPTETTFALPNPWGAREILTNCAVPSRGLVKRTSRSSLGFSTVIRGPIKGKSDSAFRSTAACIEILLVNKLWHTHTRPIQIPCCWKDRHEGMTVRQRPKRFVQIAPFWLILELFECQGTIRCRRCDPKSGKWWNDAYAFYWDLATYWAVNAPGSVDFYMK